MGAAISQYIHESYDSSLHETILLSTINELKRKNSFFEKWSIEDIKFAAGLLMDSSHNEKMREKTEKEVNLSSGKISETILASFVSSARCSWREYFHVIYQTENHRCFQYAQDMKLSKHPCMQDFACEIDHNALKEWHKYLELQEKRRKDLFLKAYYDDSYTTEDENSIKDYENLGDDDMDKDAYSLDLQNCVVDMRSLTKQVDEENGKNNGRTSLKENSSQQCGVDESGKRKIVSIDSRSSTNDSKTSNDKATSISHSSITSTTEEDSSSTRRSFSNENNTLQSSRTKMREVESVEKKALNDNGFFIPLPESFNPQTRNPIFFGYTDKKWSNLHDLDVEKKDIMYKKEGKIVKKKMMEKENSILKYISECEAKQENRNLKLQNIHEMYEATLKQNKDERQAIHLSKISEDEKNALFQQLSRDESAAINAHKIEDTSNRLKFQKLCCDEQSQIKSMRTDLENLKNEENYNYPTGNKIISRLRLELTYMTNVLESRSKLMEDEKEKLDAIKEDILSQRRSHNDSSNRSMVIFAEGRLREARQYVEQAHHDVEDQKALLQRALRRKEDEKKIISLFFSASSTTETVSIVDLLIMLTLFCNETPENKMSFIIALFDLNSDGILYKNEFICLLHCGSKTLKNIGLLHSAFDIDMIYSIYTRATFKYGINKNQGITLFEARVFLLEEIKLNSTLCSFLGIERKRTFSDLQIQQMNPIQMFEKGILNTSDLKYYFAFCQHKSRPELNRENKISMHKLAISMGAKDPLKPNYARFLPRQSKEKFSTNIIPLDHGHLANFSTCQTNSMVEASKKIQNLFRGIQARLIAKTLARKEAFFLALQRSIDEMKTKVLLEFEKKEKQKGAFKLKWDATIRLKQIKMKSMGTVLNREECILHIIEEAQKDGEKKIVNRFKELAVARGFESLSESIDNFSKPKFENKDSVSIQRSSEQQVTQHNEPNQCKLRYRIVKSTAYCTDRFDVCKANLEFDEFVTSIRNINNVMTLIKTCNIFRELPSKRLLCQYTITQNEKGELDKDLRDQFKVERDLPAVIKGFQLLVSGDLEYGLVNDTLSQMFKNITIIHESFFEYKINQEQAKSNKLKENENNNDGKKLFNEDKKSKCLNIPTKEKIETLEANLLKMQENAFQIENQIMMAQLSIEHKRWKYLYELKSNDVEFSFGARFDAGYGLRHNWIQRYLFALRMEENNNHQIEMKYVEIQNLVEDFLDVASNAATIIVNEYFLPWSQKSLRPFDQRPADGRARACGRGNDGKKYRYRYRNIQFRVLTDIDGIFDGSSELAAKLGGHELRGSKEYFKCGIEGVVIPLQAVIDTCGFRVLAVSELPIARPTYNESGGIDSIDQEQILGAIKRGESIQNCDAELNLKMKAFASKLNLAHHFVKGKKDLTSREIYCSADIKGFKDEANNYYLVNFWRSFPSENPSAAKHLSTSPRGMTIFSRMLRPEFVAKYGQPLSPDANCQIIFGVSDALAQTKENENATRYLIETMLSKFAERLSSLDLSDDYNYGFRLDLTALMHREGFNMRHLGLLRTKYWKKLKGTVNIFSQQTKIETNADLTSEIKRGSTIKICSKIYRVSTDLSKTFNSSEITIESRVNSESKNNLDAYTGEVTKETNSVKMRLLILSEMVARTSKNLARHYMRYYIQYKSRVPAKTIQVQIVTQFLNILTGVHNNSQSFWSIQLFYGIRQRFGNCAVSCKEQWELLQETRSMSIYIVRRFIDMMGIEVSNESMINLHDSKGSFRFRSSDIVRLYPRVKHNIVMKDISEALVSSFQFQDILTNSYKNTVLQDKPVLYWILSERDGSLHAHNFGSSGEILNGIFSGNITFKQDGALQDIHNSSIYFNAKKKCRVQPKSLLQFKSFDVNPRLTIEIWARVVGGKFRNRTAIMAKFCSIVATRHEVWALIICIDGVEIVLYGPRVEYDVFHHIVGTYDGVKGTLYLNGRIYAQKNIEQEILQRKKLALERKTMDQTSRQNEMNTEFLSLSNEKFQKSVEKDKITQCTQTEMRNVLKQECNSEINGNSTLNPINEEIMRKFGKNEVKGLNTNEYHKVNKNNMHCRNSFSSHHTKEAEYVNEIINKAICVGSSCDTKRFSKGYNFFDGCVCHVAIYTHCLSADAVLVHWTMSRSITRRTDLARLRSTADKKFVKIFHELPNQTSIINYFIDFICNSLQIIPGDDLSCHVDRVYQAVLQLIRIDCIGGLIKLLRNIPNEEKYAKIACKVYDSIKASKSWMSLPSRELFFLPFKFNLTHKNVALSAFIFRNLLQDLTFTSVYGTKLHWVPKLSNDNAVVALTVEAYQGSKKESIQFTKKNQCDGLSDSDFIWTIKNNISTRYLNVSGCINLSDTSLANILTYLNFLEVLIIDDCTRILGCCNVMRLQKLSRLKKFSARRCHNLSNDFIAWLVEGSKKLEYVDLQDCNHVTDKVLESFRQLKGPLSSIDISNCTAITDTGLNEFVLSTKPTELREFHLSWCSNITNKGLQSITKVTSLR